MAPLFIVPFAKKLLVPHVNSMVSNVVAFAKYCQLLLIEGHIPLGMQRPYENGI
jgi:hypothetical protein